MKVLNNNRIDSIDLARGTIVFLSLLLFSIPTRISWLNIHAEWYGFTVIDIILPGFITVFGVSMAIAYKNGVKIKRFISRTIKLILFGLIFNIIVSWSLDLSTLRFTGVLQLFAALGVATVIITRFIKKPLHLFITSIIIFTIHGFLLKISAEFCGVELATQECNPSNIIDPMIFGEQHIYAQGNRGYDPEGIPQFFAILGNVLIGYAAGQAIANKEKVEKRMLIMVLFLSLITVINLIFMPLGKRMWTPSFGYLTSGITIIIVGIYYYFLDRKKAENNVSVPTLFSPLVTLLIAIGRNSFLLYFGKYLLDAMMRNLYIKTGDNELSIRQFLLQITDKYSPIDGLLYALLIFGFWIVLATILHRRQWYLKV